MHEMTDVQIMTAALDVGVTRTAQAAGMAKLTPLHREVVETLPTVAKQEIRVIRATLLPADVTPYHFHRHPVTVHMTAGVFTLRLDGRDPVRLAAGDTFVEPAHVNMTGSNEGETPAEMVLFYVCEPDEPFADLAEL